MNSVGEYFKQVREAKGLTLEEVASKTRIHPEFLKALEEGNFAKLPDQVFAKGFVRAYARSLGMDEDETIRRFGESAGAFYGRQGELERLRLQQETLQFPLPAIEGPRGLPKPSNGLIFIHPQGSGIGPDKPLGEDLIGKLREIPFFQGLQELRVDAGL